MMILITFVVDAEEPKLRVTLDSASVDYPLNDNQIKLLLKQLADYIARKEEPL